MKENASFGPAAPDSADQAARAVANARFIDDLADLDRAAGTWAAAPILGLDTEFVRERTFWARPGLVQISEGNQVWLLDAATLKSIPPLASVLDDTGVIKVVHSVGEDLEVLHAVSGTVPEPLFDTQIAAAMLGLPLQCRYEHLVEEVFGVHLPGGKARNDWCRRPLAPALLEYAAQDVIWLPRLCAYLWERLEAVGRLAWLREDCARIVEQSSRGDLTPPLSRVKGAGRLGERELSVVDALAFWREQQARERDLPRRFVLSDEALIEIARAAISQNVNAAIETLPDRLQRRFGSELRPLLEQHKPEGFARPPLLTALDEEQRQSLGAAQGVVRQLAEELQVEPALIASKKELTRLVRGEKPPWLDGWRGELLRPRFQAASVSISSA